MDAPKRRRRIAVAICSFVAVAVGVSPSAAAPGAIDRATVADASVAPAGTPAPRIVHGDGPNGLVANPVSDPRALNRYLAEVAAETRASTQRRLASGSRAINIKLVPVQFQGDPRVPLPSTTAMGRLIGDPNSIRNYYLEQTNGRVSVTAQALSTVTIPFGPPDCNVDQWTAAADAAAGIGTLPVDTMVMYYWPALDECDFLGLAELNGPHAWINDDFERVTVAHEIGHLLGTGHARSRACVEGVTPVALSSNCVDREYGDPFDVMGGGPTGSLNHMTASHKLNIGAFGPEDVQEATATGRFTIAPLESAPSATPRSLTIGRTPGTNFFIESRRALTTQFDAFAPTDPVANGVLIHLDAPGDKWTHLLDLHPSTSTFTDAPLLVGESFQDPSSGVSIQLVSVSDSGAVLDVGIVDTSPPTAPGPLSGYSFSTKDIRLIWNASIDNRSNPKYQVERDGVVVAITKEPFFYDSGLATSSTHRYRVVAVDAAGNFSEPSNTVDVATQSESTPLSVAPATTPTTSILPPSKGSVVSTRVTLKLSALKRTRGRYSVRALGRASDDCRYRFGTRPWRPCEFAANGRFSFAVLASRRRPVSVSVEAASLSGVRVVRTLKLGK